MKRALFIIAGVIIVAFLAFLILSRNKDSLAIDLPEEQYAEETVESVNSVQSETEPVIWEFTGNEWKPSRDPPECPEPLIFQMPADIDSVTSVLYPGQFRPDYKPHGGFRFDKPDSSAINVYAPFEGYVLKGGRYFASGEIQYVFFILHPCGIMYRLGHLKKLTPKFETLAETLPEPKELDSRDYIVEHVPIEKGELVATEVGVTDNYFFDWGVYDLRKKNDASKNIEWFQEHDNDQAPYAICWLDFLSSEESARIKSLPGADGASGKESDYCG